MKEIKLTGSDVTLETTWLVSHGHLRGNKVKVVLSDEARAKVKQSRAYIETKMKTGDAIYGVNTGFGAFSSVRISQEEIELLQRNLIREALHPQQRRVVGFVIDARAD